MKNHSSPKIIVLFFLIAFSSFAFGQPEKSSDKKSFLTEVQITEADKIKVFDNLWQTVNRLYFDPAFNGVNWSQLREIYLPQAVAAKDKLELLRILNKMVGEIKTSHLSVSFEVSISGKELKNLFGEKVDFSQNDIIFDYGFSTANFGGQSVVTLVEKNSSAEGLGIKPGWIMRSCKDEPKTKREGDFLINTESAHCVFSNENGEEKILIIDKSFFLKPRSSVTRISKVLPDNILYLKFNAFDKGLGKWIKQEITKNRSAKAVILDLRGNHGGWVEEVRETLSVFFPPQTVVGSFTERDLDEKIFRVGSNDAYKGKILVLIDEKSTSGAELSAAAFQETGRGKIVGQKSAGQLLNGITKSLSNGLKLHVAVRDYKTVKGARLEAKGVVPDVEIHSTIDDFRHGRDGVLEKALEILQSGN